MASSSETASAARERTGSGFRPMADSAATTPLFCHGLKAGFPRKSSMNSGAAPNLASNWRLRTANSCGEDSTKARWNAWLALTTEIAVPMPPPTMRPVRFMSVAPAAMARDAVSSSARRTGSRVKGLTPSFRQSSARLRCTPRAASAASVAPTFPSAAFLTVVPRRPKNFEAPFGSFWMVCTGSFTAEATLWSFSPPEARSALPNSSDLFILRSAAIARISRSRFARNSVPVTVSVPSGPLSV